MKTKVVLAALFASLSCAHSPAFADVKVEETIVGPANAGGLYIVSQNEGRIAYVGAKDTRTIVSVEGVEGPVLDELLGGSAAVVPGSGPVLVHAANSGGKFNGTPSAVIFSDTGAHYAYMGRQGNEYVVILDGKEVGRGPRLALSLSHSPLGISPNGKFAYWGEMKTENGRGTHRLIMNGKPGPWAGHQDIKPVFSSDDSRFAYTAGTVEDYQKPMLIVDGNVVNYVGRNPQFTADHKLLLTATDLKGVLVEGKPLSINAYIGVEKITPAPVGGRIAVIVRKKNVNHEGVGTLYLDGKEVPGTEGAMEITFSPDGKHWALRCKNPEAKSFFMVIDGKKGTEYQIVAEKAYWTPDSSKVIYQISNSGRNFIVVNTEEFAVQNVNALMRAPVLFAKTGGRYTFSSTDGSNRNFLTIVDGKQVLPPGFYPNSDSFEFSDNGERYAYAVGQIGRQGMVALVDNGTVYDKMTVGAFVKYGGADRLNLHLLLSPDGKYLARMSATPDNKSPGLYVNEKQVYPTSRTVALPCFTPDSKHLFWIANETFPDRPQPYHVIYVDGAPAVKVSSDNFGATKGSWSMGADGVFTFAAVVGDVVKRHRVTADPAMNIDKMITLADAKQVQAVAEAAAAKKKAEDDALAAAEKKKTDAEAAAAKRKADAEAYAAKRKADYDAAVAARAKARQDALDARQKAGADAAAARAAKQKR